MLILLILAYILLGLLALLLALLAVALWSPVDFAGRVYLTVEPAGDPMAFAGMWMDEAPWGGDDEEELEITADAAAHGRVRLLWGAVQVSDKGVRVLWWRSKQGGGAGGREARARIRAKFKGDSLDVEVTAERAAAGDAAQGQPAKEKGGRRGRRRRDGFRFTLRDFRRLWPDIRRAIGRSWAALRLRLRVFVTIGLEDPATTGLLAGFVPAVVSPLIWSTNARRQGSIVYRITPVFNREVLAADFELAGRTTLWGVGIAWIKLALRRDVRRLWWPRRRRKEKGGPNKT